jgi:hypothetical protein
MSVATVMAKRATRSRSTTLLLLSGVDEDGSGDEGEEVVVSPLDGGWEPVVVAVTG